MKELNKDFSFFTKMGKSDEAFKKLCQDEELRRRLSPLKLTDKDIFDNFALIDSYHDDYQACESCPGKDKCPKELPLTMVEIRKENGVLHRYIVPCSKNDSLKDPRYSFLEPYRDFPEEWLDNSRFSLPRTKRVMTVFKSFKEALNDSDHPWVYLEGEENAGKSFLLSSFSIGYGKTGKNIAFVNTPQRFDQLKFFSVKERGTFDDLMVRLASAPLLVLDDFGKEFHSDYVRDTILLPLLYVRANHKLMTFFSSRYSLGQIEKLWSYSALSKEKAPEIVALIKDNIASTGPVIVEKGFESYLSSKKS